MNSKKNFDALWSEYMNSTLIESRERALLKECLAAAQTIDDAGKVLTATSSSEDYLHGLPALALKRMVEISHTLEEAKRVYALASMKKCHTSKFMYPAREKEAKAKLESFANV